MSNPEASASAVALRLARTFLLPRWPGLAAGSLCAVAAAACTGALATLLQPAVGPLLSTGGVGNLGELPALLAALALGRALAASVGSLTLL